MPPKAETTMLVDHQEDSAPPKNVTFAINYEVTMVDEFVASPHRQRRVVMKPESPVETLPESTSVENNLIIHCTNNNDNTPSNSHHADATGTTASSSKDGSSLLSFNSENSAPNSSDEDNISNNNGDSSRQPTTTDLTTTQSDKTRRSARGKQGKRRDAALARTRVRYDMQIVPHVHRNKDFLDKFPLWWMMPSSAATPPQRTLSRRKLSASSRSLPPPFSEDTSVVWIPSKRTEWEDSVSEMTAVCTSAALHRHAAAVASSSNSNTSSKLFHPPLSRDYIRDRVDIDDPLLGYQIRHKTGGWLQGFCLWTNFTTWTHYFKWDSLHEQSGMTALCAGNPATTSASAKVDRDGSLAQELEALPREGDPMGGGIVFSAIAEIGLVGALGCGEYLLRMALDDIREKKQYRFVVLQATDSSKAFYERFAFVRVGAICKYYVGNASSEEQPIVGYRHWTHANESDASLQMHGGPSYMMCLKLPPIESSSSDVGERPASSRTNQPSFLEAMLTLEVDEKPTIEQLGGTSTPSLCRTIQRRNSKASSFSTTDQAQPPPPPSNVVKKKARVVAVSQPPGPPSQRSGAAAPNSKRKASPAVAARTIVNPSLPSTGAMKRRLSTRGSLSFAEQAPPAKKFKPSGSVENTPRDVLLSPPPEGKPLTYAQKQYQSVWLAVPPDDVKAASSKSPRPPPKPRLSDTSAAAFVTRATTPRITAANDSAKRAATSTTTKAVAAVKEQEVSTTVAFLYDNAAAAEQLATTVASSDKASLVVVQSEPTALAAKEEATAKNKPTARGSPKRAAATGAAAAVAASSTSAPKQVENATTKVASRISSTRQEPKKSDKSVKVPTPPTRELPKRAAAMPKPPGIAPAKDTQRKAPARARSRSNKAPKPDERLYYSVRGPDGRFVRVPIGTTITYTASVKASSKSVPQTNTQSLPSPPTNRAATSLSRTSKPTTGKITVAKVKRAERSKPAPPTVEKVRRVDRAELRKQKVHSYPRTRPHFYNRVVKPVNGAKTYFFVLNYNEDTEQLRLVPMGAKSTLTGQREGRPRYQCAVGDTDANFLTVSANDYQVVTATMVMKTPLVALEAWDIEDD